MTAPEKQNAVGATLCLIGCGCIICGAFYVHVAAGLVVSGLACLAWARTAFGTMKRREVRP